MPSLPFAVIPTPLGTMTAGNETAGHPVTHLGEFDTVGMTWQASGSVWARGNFGSAKPIDFMAMLGANAVPGGTSYRLRLGSSQADVDTDAVLTTITNHANTTVTSLGANEYQVTKTGGSGSALDAGAVSATAISGDFVLRVQPGQTNRDFHVGTNTAPTAATTNADFLHMLSFNGSAQVRVYQSGALVAGPTTYTASQYWFIRRVGTTVTVLYGTSTDISLATLYWTFSTSSATLYFDSSIFQLSTTFKVLFGSGGGGALYDSGTLTFVNPTITREDGLYSSHLELPSTVTAQWWRVDITGLPSVFEASALVLGQKVTPANYYAPGFEFGVEDLGALEVSRYGVPEETPGKIFRTLGFRLGWLSEGDFETKFRPLVEKLGKRKVALWCFDPTANIYRQNRTYFGWVRNAPVASHVANTTDGPRFQKQLEILSMV